MQPFVPILWVSLSRLLVVGMIGAGVWLSAAVVAAAEEAPTPAAGERGINVPETPKVAMDAALAAATPKSWSAAGLKAARDLAAKVKAAGVACDQCEEGVFGFIDPKIAGKLPDPQAVLSCVGNAEEDITFEIFSNAEDTRRFLKEKRAYLCRQSFNNKLWFYPGFPYVAGDTWVIEPDDMLTAKEIAKVFGGTAVMADCVGIWPTPAAKKTPAATP